jgi:hypothetical protein
MAVERTPESALLFVAVTTGCNQWFEAARQELGGLFGVECLSVGPWPLGKSRYYERQMGPGLERAILAYATKVAPDSLAQAKRKTNALEVALAKRLCAGVEVPERPVNLDPGIVTPPNVVLASMKPARARVCLAGGVYAEPALYYVDGEHHAFPWTYTSYRTREVLAFFVEARALLLTR